MAMARMEPTVTELTERTAKIRTEPTAPTLTARTAATPTEPTALTPTAPTADPDPCFRNLAALIGAAQVADFLDATLGKAAYQTQLPPGLAGELFGWAQLNAALAVQRLIPPRLRLERGGVDVTRGIFTSRRARRGPPLQDLAPAELMAQLREGATLIVDSVNEISAPLQKLCAGLSAEFTAACQANMYACWGTTQGFDVHWDDHDVFVVQVEGRKQWALYGPTDLSPTRKGKGAPARQPEGDPEIVVLEAGDVLYLPRGYWHAAVGLGGPTLHLTIGLTRKTASDMLHWLADELLTEDWARLDLPFEQGDAAVASRLAELLSTLGRHDARGLAQRYRRTLEAALPQRPQLSFPYIGEETVPIGPKARIRLAPGPVWLAPSERGLVLSWCGVEFTLAPELEPSVRRMLAGAELSVAEFSAAVPQASASEIQDLLREMARRGAFIVGGEAGV